MSVPADDSSRRSRRSATQPIRSPESPLTTAWRCPKCSRGFTRKNQRHACGTGDRAEVLRNRPPEVVSLYVALEAFARTLGPVEFVTRDRYVLFRSRRIFADAVVMADALRLAIHLPRKVKHRLFTKVGSDRRHVTHVARLRTLRELEAMKPFLREAHEHSMS
jgi:predicted transport protein